MKNFTSPPYLESICEIIFMPSVSHDLTIPGLMYAALKDDFPNKSENTLAQIPVRDTNDNKLFQLLTPQLSQFFSLDRSSVIQVGKDVVINNNAYTYKGWGAFSEQIRNTYELYKSYSSNYLSIRQITLKFIFKFDVEKGMDYRKIFTFSMPNPPGPSYEKNKAVQTSVEYEYGNNVLNKSFKTILSRNANEDSWLLEISYVNINPDNINDENLNDWLEGGNKLIEILFKDALKKEYNKFLIK